MSMLSYVDFLDFFRKYPGCRVMLHLDYKNEKTEVVAQTIYNGTYPQCVSLSGVIRTEDVCKLLAGQNYWQNTYCANNVWCSDIALDT